MSVAGIVIQLQAALEPLSLRCREGKQEQNILFYPLAVRSSLAAVIARCSSAQLTGLRTHPSRRRKRSLEAAGDAAAAAAFAPSRRGMREAVGVGAAEDPRQHGQKIHSSDPKPPSHEQTVVDESLCALRGNMRARERACVRACGRFIPQSDAL